MTAAVGPALARAVVFWLGAIGLGVIGLGSGQLAAGQSASSAESELSEAFQRAVEWMKEGNFAEARSVLEALVRARPDDLAARNNLAACLIRTGRFEEAETHLLIVLREAPARANARLNLGVVDQARGETDEAAAETDRAYELYGRRPTLRAEWAAALFNRGWLKDELEDFSAAEELYREALAQWPGYGRAWIALGVTLAKQDKWEPAREALERGRRLVEDDTELTAVATRNLEVLAKMHPETHPTPGLADSPAGPSDTPAASGPPARPSNSAPSMPASTASSSDPEQVGFARGGLLGWLGIAQDYRAACIFGFLAVFAIVQVYVSGWMVNLYGKPLLGDERTKTSLVCGLFGAALFFLCWGYEPWGWWIATAVVSVLVGVARD